MNKKTISIGVPTYEAFESLSKTLSVLYNLEGFNRINEVIVVSDGNKIDKNTLNKIKHKKLKVINNLIRKGHSARINQLMRVSNADYLILINDDVILHEKSLTKVIINIENKNFDLLSANAKPLKALNLFERIIEVGTVINENLSKNWNNYQNYLSCNGRMVVLSKRFYETLKLPEILWNSDAYIFLQCKINNFKYVHDNKLIVFYRSPSNLKEHIRQSKKFRHSVKENAHYLGNVEKYYKLPKLISIKALIDNLMTNPVLFVLYVYILIQVTISKSIISQVGYWETDKSTKNL